MSILTNILIGYAVICTILTTLFLIGLVKNLRRVLGASTTIEEIRDHIKLVYTEQVGNAHYLYDHTNRFITQGNTEEEMWTKAKLLFPKKEFIMQGEDGKAMLVSVKDKINV